MDVHTVLTSWKVVFIILILVSVGVRQSSCCAPITHIEIGKLRAMQSTELLHWLACRFYGNIVMRNFFHLSGFFLQLSAPENTSESCQKASTIMT